MNHPDNKGKPPGRAPGMDVLWKDPESTLTKWRTPLMENEKIVELPVDQRTVTRRYTQKAIDFITTNQKKPFFVYLPHSMPHIPLYVPDEVRDPNPLNAYTNTIEHIDAEVGRLMDKVRELGLSKNTYVIYTTDNGPWLPFKHHGGSAGPLRDGKGSTFEGGQRVPCVMWAPGRIPAGTECHELMGTIDLLPTIAALTGASLPKDQKIDGLDASSLLTKKVKSPRNEFLYYTSRGDIQGLRQGKWKLLIKTKKKPRNAGKNWKAPDPEILLFDLISDMGEKKNLAEENPKKIKDLTKRMNELDTEIAKNARSPWHKSE
tara:strand:- start:1873 stop:2826 length:954 start_codon:yes stop_codon:yes gene_type:complete